MRFGVASSIVLAACLALPAAPVLAQSTITRAQAKLPVELLTIRAATGAHLFRVEVARSPIEQETGLMFRKSVAPSGGMIFPMKPIRVASFWMQNTLIPLDMLFIRADGTIARVVTARALSTDIDDSGEPVAAVLELRAGRARQLGIKAGDRTEWAGLRR